MKLRRRAPTVCSMNYLLSCSVKTAAGASADVFMASIGLRARCVGAVVATLGDPDQRSIGSQG
jgi:hypothetical protein